MPKLKTKSGAKKRFGRTASGEIKRNWGHKRHRLISNAYRIAIERVEKGLQYAYRDRRNRKRDFRALWIQRINAGAREHGLTYSQFMHGIKLAGLELDRKVLSDLAIREPEAFQALASFARAALSSAPAAAAAE